MNSYLCCIKVSVKNFLINVVKKLATNGLEICNFYNTRVLQIENGKGYICFIILLVFHSDLTDLIDNEFEKNFMCKHL